MGTQYFFVVITNTIPDNGDGGNKTAPVTSDVVSLTVAEQVNAQEPVIDEQPQGATVTVGIPRTLSVDARSTDGGTISYQWFSANSADVFDNEEELIENITEIDGATNSTFTPSTDETGTFFYFVVVTNTIPEGDYTVATEVFAISDVITLTVTVATDAPPQPTLTGTPETNSITVNAILAPDGWTTQYRIRTAPDGEWSAWQNSNVFTDLTVGTAYQVQARFTADNTATHEHSPESPVSVSIQTADYILWGDVNEDGEVNTDDIVLIQRWIAGDRTIVICLISADANDDGKVTVFDIIWLHRYLAGEYALNPNRQ